jgi:hypothetical protein
MSKPAHTESNTRQPVKKFKHVPLERPAEQMRLSRIRPGEKRELISCALQVFELSDAPPYRALSYTWGDANHLMPIRLDEKLHLITPNCWYALWQLRLHHGLDTWFWIDAICIDQANVPEKNEQVRRMGAIYRQAKCVCVSVGRHKDGSDFLFSLITE